MTDRERAELLECGGELLRAPQRGSRDGQLEGEKASLYGLVAPLLAAMDLAVR